MKGEFTGTGVSPEIVAQKADFTLSGTFVGTVVAQAKDVNDNWVTLSNVIATMTAPDVIVMECATPRPMRLQCTLFTSGPIEYSVEGVTDTVNPHTPFYDSAGNIRD